MSTLTVPANNSPRLVPIGQAAKLAAVHVDTIRRYMASGLIEGVVTPGGHRRVNLSSVADAFGVTIQENDSEETGESLNEGGLVVVFARVSSKKQEQAGDLTRQVDDLQRYSAEHYAGQRVRVLKGVGSGLNDSRPEFLTLIDLIVARKVSVVLCTYRERLARFGLNVIQHLAKANGVQIVEIGGEDGAEGTKERTLQEDMVESCLAVLHCFSAKMNGIRGGARTKMAYPAGFTERVASLAGAGMSRRDIVKTLAADSPAWTCENTGKPLGERAVRRVLASLGGAPVVPASVKTFLRKRCAVGPAKNCPSSSLYSAYVQHCQTVKTRPLTQDKMTHFLKTAVPHLEIDNGKVSVMSGLTLKASA